MRQFRRALGKQKTHILATPPGPKLQLAPRNLIENGCPHTAIGQLLNDVDHELHPQLIDDVRFIVDLFVTVQIDLLGDQVHKVHRELFRCQQLLA